MLGVCCPNMQFIYVLPGWEGSVHDGRLLRDAIYRPNGLKIPRGKNGIAISTSSNTFSSFLLKKPLIFLYGSILKVVITWWMLNIAMQRDFWLLIEDIDIISMNFMVIVL